MEMLNPGTGGGYPYPGGDPYAGGGYPYPGAEYPSGSGMDIPGMGGVRFGPQEFEF